MDPNLFHIDWEQTAEVLTTIVVLAFLVERAMALVFESQWYLTTLADKHIKELLTLVLCIGICLKWKLDAVSIILHGNATTVIGEVVTAAVIAGGSKASLKLFRDVMNIESERARAVRQRPEDEKPKTAAAAAGTAQ